MSAALGIGAGIGAFLFVLLSLVSWRTMAALLMGLAVLDRFLMLDLSLQVERGLTIQPTDILFFALGLSGVVRLAAIRRLGRLRQAWLVLAILLAADFLMGMSSFGFSSAAIQYRQMYYLSAGILYFSSFPYDTGDERFVKWIILVTALIISAFGLLAWIDPDLNVIDREALLTANAFDAYRVLPVAAAMFIGVAFLLAFPSWIDLKGAVPTRLLALILLAMVLFLYHRTVWVMLLGAWVLLFWMVRQHILALSLSAIGAISILAILWLVMSGFEADTISEPMRAAVTETMDEHSSLAWRIDGWRTLVGNAIDQGIITILFGQGFGVSFLRNVYGAYIDFSPHSMYVEIFLNGGVLSAGLYALLLLWTLKRQISRYRQTQNLSDAVFAAFLLTNIIFGISYNVHYDMSVLIGMIVSILSGLERSNSPARLSVPHGGLA